MNDQAMSGLIAARELIKTGRTWSADAVKEVVDDMELAIGERDEARAAVRKGRSIVRETKHMLKHHKRQSCNCEGCTWLNDTESYEQYR